jgi:GTPase SAR1 family protein
VIINNVKHDIRFWEIVSAEACKSVRQLSYPGTDVFLMCFSIADRNSFENIKNKWGDEIRFCVKKPHFILVGTKADLRESAESPVRESEGEIFKTQIGAFAYCECSALRNHGVNEAINQAIVYATLPRERVGCCVVE